MVPTDSDVTWEQVGNDQLSEGDIAKIQCLYHCDDCGGHKMGENGEIGSSGVSTCKWVIRVDDGFGISMAFKSFSVSKITAT